jgi:hypothetical protein
MSMRTTVALQFVRSITLSIKNFAKQKDHPAFSTITFEFADGDTIHKVDAFIDGDAPWVIRGFHLTEDTAFNAEGVTDERETS